MATTRMIPPSLANQGGPLTLISLSDATLRPTQLDATRPTLLGRQSQCDIQLADQTVSRVHAIIECKLGSWYITDKASRLGTLLNGARLEAEQPTTIRDGDVLSIARWSFKAHAGSADSAGPAATIIGSSRLSDGQQGRVETFKSDVLLSRAEQRLHLVMDLAASLHAASDEKSLATAIVAAAAKGSNYERCAVVKLIPGTDVVTVQAASIKGVDAPEGFAFSRSLVRAAATGEIAKLTGDTVLRQAVSIISQGIRSAVCAPITVGSDIGAYLYLDNADNDPPTVGDVDAFIAAVARIASLALAELSRRQLKNRHDQLSADLTAARHAQVQLMPAPSGTFGPVTYAAKNKPGRLVAGDLVDVIDLGNDRVAACLGDVSGKGVGAAMLMAAAQTQLRATLRQETDLARAIMQLNREVVSRLMTDGFISLWAGVIDTRANTLTFVDAGHSYWALRTTDSLAVGPAPECMPLGIDADEQYVARTMPFHPGDRLTVYSDGVAEQLSPNGAQFRPEGVIEALRNCGDEAADVEILFETLRTFAGSDAFADDVTILSLRY
ncbi:MAG: SpoIIE family protein phosphatase [Planctomycetota bacterium]|nr:SpoIIE family protein phosphatase [Planctomycetota bacterium]